MDAKEPPIPEYPNLRPFSHMDREERVKIASLGGKASGVARRKRRTFAEEIKIALQSTIQPSHPKYAEIKRMLRSSGLLPDGEEPTNQMLVVFGMMQTAQKKPEAAAFLRDTIGEKPADLVGNFDIPAAPIVIGIHDADYVGEEKRKQIEERKEIESRQLGKTQSPVGEASRIEPENPGTSAPTAQPLPSNADNPPAEADTAAENDAVYPVIVYRPPEKAEIPPRDASDETNRPSTPPDHPTPPAPEIKRSVPPPDNPPDRLPKHRPGKFVCIPAAFPRR